MIGSRRLTYATWNTRRFNKYMTVEQFTTGRWIASPTTLFIRSDVRLIVWNWIRLVSWKECLDNFHGRNESAR